MSECLESFSLGVSYNKLVWLHPLDSYLFITVYPLSHAHWTLLEAAPFHLLCFCSSHTPTHRHPQAHTHIHTLTDSCTHPSSLLLSFAPSKISLTSPYEEETSLIPSGRDHQLYLHPEKEGRISMFSTSSLQSLLCLPRCCPEPPQMSPVTASSPCTQSLFHKNNYCHKNDFWLDE